MAKAMKDMEKKMREMEKKMKAMADAMKDMKKKMTTIDWLKNQHENQLLQHAMAFRVAGIKVPSLKAAKGCGD